MPDGSVYVLRRSARDSDGALVEMEFVLPGGCVAPPPHVHRHQVEQYEVIEGRFEVLLEGAWQSLGPGETASVPRRRAAHVPQSFRRSRPGAQLAPAGDAL